MYIAEGRMRGNMGTFVIEEALDEDEATVDTRRCYKCLTAEGVQVKHARKASPDTEEEIIAILQGHNRNRYRVYNLDDDRYFIEFFTVPN